MINKKQKAKNSIILRYVLGCDLSVYSNSLSSEFKKLFESRFEIIEEFEVKEKFYMPTLAGFVMRKRNENITN